MPTRSRSSSGGSEGGRRGRLWEAEPPTRTSSSRTAAAAAHGHQQRWEETTAKPLRRRRRSSGTVPAQLEPHAQQQPSSVAASAASAPQVFETAHAFRIGELVERRDSGEDWKEGYVTSLVPLEVTVNADPRADGYSWDEVRPRGARDLPPPQRPTSEPARSSIAADAAAARALPTEHLLSSDSSHSVEEAPSTSPAKGKRRGSLVATDRWALASKELHGKARRELSGIASEQAARTLADERAIIFSVTVYHLGEVNLVQQSFFADVGIHMSWMEPDLKDLERTSDVTDLSPSDPRVHIPTFFIENRLEVKSITDAIVTMRRKDPKGVVRWEQRFAGTFMELLDLRYFPFDVQTLSIGARRISIRRSVLPPRRSAPFAPFLTRRWSRAPRRAARQLEVRRCARALRGEPREGKRLDQEARAPAGVAHPRAGSEGVERREGEADVQSPHGSAAEGGAL